jgi:hypothetical protein
MSLLKRAIEAHGGRERWSRVGAVDARLRSGGLAYPLRRRSAPVELRMHIDPHRPHNVLQDWPLPGQRGIFEADRVWIEAADGAVLAERVDPRAAFRGLSRKSIRWDDLDFLYFAGYASWNYLTTPFLLASPGVEVREREGGRLDVTFPPSIPTHSRHQTFWFDERAYLVRRDYTAEVFGRWARAAQFCSAHYIFNNIVMPTRRRVVPRAPGDRPLPGPTLMWSELLDYQPRLASHG